MEGLPFSVQTFHDTNAKEYLMKVYLDDRTSQFAYVTFGSTDEEASYYDLSTIKDLVVRLVNMIRSDQFEKEDLQPVIKRMVKMYV